MECKKWEIIFKGAFFRDNLPNNKQKNLKNNFRRFGKGESYNPELQLF